MKRIYAKKNAIHLKKLSTSFSRDRNPIQPNGFDSRHPPTPHHQSVGVIVVTHFANISALFI